LVKPFSCWLIWAKPTACHTERRKAFKEREVAIAAVFTDRLRGEVEPIPNVKKFV
jgi:hypothetical protein